MKKILEIIAFVIGILFAGQVLAGLPTSMPSAASRSFYMGFTPAEYDATPEALEETYAFINQNADIITHHFASGVPWQEALEKRPYHDRIEADLNYRVKKLDKKQKVFLYLTPLTVLGDDMAGYWAEEDNMPRKGEWASKDFDNPDVISAYTNFIRDMIKRFHPDFLGYAIEVNNYAKNKPTKWNKFLKFAKQVYTTLKAENPNLPIFVSVAIDEFEQENQKQAIQDILPYSDYLAVSTYPYIFGYADPYKLPKDYFSRVVSLSPQKPFVVAETGFIAENMDAFGVKVQGNQKWQNKYLEILLAESQKSQAKFVNWFVSRDYDPLFEKIKVMKVSHEILDLFKVYKDTGLVDGKGKRRMALETWKQWFVLPKK